MADPADWITRHRPEKDPDYLRIVEATSVVEAEMAKTGPVPVLGRRFDCDTALRFGMRRTEQTSQNLQLDNPPAAALLRPLTALWAEGFAFGALAYRQEERGREPEPILDQVALVNIDLTFATSDDTTRTRIFASIVSTDALSYVSLVRSLQGEKILREHAPSPCRQEVAALLAGHWADGFLLGLVFEELGGHRG